ncbi:hypothetical protein [Microterricola viridarii]|uniref:Uncharacterized protein n=1 Tax=Microterricola viridarii TaxID=412690 RepID=A0A0Y0MHP9_9MICO|nr:hypothetical protein [Microterricola viridarii]AMB57910.1 hypothetical protein AWU67_02420 [Microterricola viridarii]
MTRIWNVVRMHLVNRWTYVVLPWIILGTAFTITIAIWMILRSVGVPSDGLASGAVTSIIIYLMVAAIMSINLSFPFALGFSVTRREFYLGTALTFTLISAANAVALSVLAAIEQASDGWWLGGMLFTAAWNGGGSPLEHFFVYFAIQLLFFFLGAAIATIYMRWRINGMVVFWIVGGAALVGLFALVAYTNSWAAIGAWAAANGMVGIAAWSLLLTAVAGVAGYAVLRRATPKN